MFTSASHAVRCGSCPDGLHGTAQAACRHPRTGQRPGLRHCLLAAVLALGWLPPAWAMPLDGPGVTDSALAVFGEALEAARAGRLQQLQKLEKRLGDDHPLQGYLDFHRLREQLPELPIESVQAFAARYADSPLAGSLERLALQRFARAGRYEAVTALRDSAPGNDELACYWWRARIHHDPDATMEFVRRQWDYGHSRPAACDPLFDRARSEGIIDDAAVWKRMRNAFRAGNPGLVNHLFEQLSGDDYRQAGRWLRRLYRSPQKLEALPEDLASERRGQLLADGLHRMARLDTPAALATFREQRDSNALSEEQQTTIAGRIAWYITIRNLPDNQAWTDQWIREHAGPELREQRARRAVIEQDWQQLPDWIDRLPPRRQDSARWHYWRGRALQAAGDEQRARQALVRAAKRRSFWGFTAAEHLGREYSLRDVDAVQPQRLTPRAALIRITMLRELGEFRLARREWLKLLRDGDPEAESLARHASARGWYELAIAAALRAGAMDHLEWRFPVAYRDAFMNAAVESGTDPYLLMAIARRESSFYPAAVSPAGALGLMQIMPGTARRISDWLDRPAPEREQLLQRHTSIRLGSTYMAALLERYRGNRPLALAAYNAGKHRVDQWLPEEPVPFDVWIESIPFRETRNYVQAVLAYRVLLAAMDRPTESRMVPPVLAHAEWQQDYGASMLAPDDQGTELAAAE